MCVCVRERAKEMREGQSDSLEIPRRKIRTMRRVYKIQYRSRSMYILPVLGSSFAHL